MKLLILVCMYGIASAFYTDVDEKIDLEKLIKNLPELHKWVDCFLDKGPCTDSMNSYKKHFNQAIDNACADCSPLQKHIVEEFIKVMIVKYPNDLDAIKQKYDPEGSHFKRILEELAKY